MKIEIPLGEVFKKIEDELNYEIESHKEFDSIWVKEQSKYFNREMESIIKEIADYSLDELAKYLLQIAVDKGIQKYKQNYGV